MAFTDVRAADLCSHAERRLAEPSSVVDRDGQHTVRINESLLIAVHRSLSVTAVTPVGELRRSL
jgi:hypothetical protein